MEGEPAKRVLQTAAVEHPGTVHWADAICAEFVHAERRGQFRD